MIKSEIIKEAKIYMQECTQKNKAPARELTEIAIEYGSKMAKLYNVDENKVLLALYLAHCVFSNRRGDETQKSHTILSSKQARIRMTDKDISDDDINDICRSIELHHHTQDSGDIFCEVVKNAEGFKFLTTRGIMVFMHHLGKRGLSYEEAKDFAIHKIKQKYSYLTLEKAKKMADDFIKNYENII